MSELYDTDAVTWAEQQAALLRHIAAGERGNDQVDWEHVVEEIEDVGGRGADPSRHGAASIPHNSMRQYMTPESWREDYQSALLETASHMADEWPSPVALPSDCPWTLDELLAEGEAARHWKPDI